MSSTEIKKLPSTRALFFFVIARFRSGIYSMGLKYRVPAYMLYIPVQDTYTLEQVAWQKN